MGSEADAIYIYFFEKRCFGTLICTVEMLTEITEPAKASLWVGTRKRCLRFCQVDNFLLIVSDQNRFFTTLSIFFRYNNVQSWTLRSLDLAQVLVTWCNGIEFFFSTIFFLKKSHWGYASLLLKVNIDFFQLFIQFSQFLQCIILNLVKWQLDMNDNTVPSLPPIMPCCFSGF